MKRLETIYHPDNTSDAEFVKSFVIRKQELQTIISSIEKQDKKSLQHFLIIGKRGMGKSTLLRRIDIELKHKKFTSKLISVRIVSEGYRSSKLYKFWEQVIELLSIQTPSLLNKKTALEQFNDYEENLIVVINDHLNQQKKSLLLLIDNFDVVIKNFNKKEQQQLREILIQYPIQIIGNTLFYDEAFIDYHKPFYNFFKIIRLNNLDAKESNVFIEDLLKEEKENGKEINSSKNLATVNTLRILSGGVPRTIILLVNVLLDDKLDSTMEHLKKLLELVTPLYQDRMKSLSAQQQEIMWAMAMVWNKTGTKEIAQKTRMESKTVSAQLAVLEQNGYVAKSDAVGKNKFYLIDERFFNIWLLMSEGTQYDGKRVLWLTKSLDMLLDKEDITHYAKSCLSKLNTPDNKFFFTQALVQSEKLDITYKIDLLNEYSEIENTSDESKLWIKNKKEELNKNHKEINKIKVTDNKEFQDNDFVENINLLELEISRGNNSAYNELAIIYNDELKDYTKAEKYYLLAIENKDIKAMFNLALMYEVDLKDYVKAEKYYLLAIENKDIKAMFNLALMYEVDLIDYVKAEKYYLLAIESKVVESIYNLAVMYFENNKNKEKCLALIKDYIIKDKSINKMYFISIILLWNEKVKEAQNVLVELLKNSSQEKLMQKLETTLLYFLVFKQKHFLYQLFTNHTWLKDQYKPLYFAILTELKDEKQNEYLTMPPELEEPVATLLKEINENRMKYNV
jgi:TPR repeat protein/energy-coupling factor transporter ATP-binding protein EcfA2